MNPVEQSEKSQTKTKTEFKNGKWVVTTTTTTHRLVDGCKSACHILEMRKFIDKKEETFDKYPTTVKQV